MKRILGVTAIAASLFCVAPASAATTIFSGNLVGAPYWQWGVPYNVIALNYSVSGKYVMTVGSGFDSMLYVYAGGFNPGAANLNLINYADDSIGLNAQITQYLNMGVNYYIVVSSYDNANLGSYTVTVEGGAVPEPESWALMVGGFGMIGAAMRRRQKVTTRVRFA